jgi:hypothetical protein
VSLTAEAVTQILEGRYDWYSARAVLRLAAGAAGLDPAGPFDARQVEALADALLKTGDRVEKTAAGLREAAARTAAPSKAPAADAPAQAEPAIEGEAGEDGADKKGPRVNKPARK